MVVVTLPLELDDILDAMIDDNKYRTDILDSRMDSTVRLNRSRSWYALYKFTLYLLTYLLTGGGGRQTKVPVDPQATLRQYPPLNLFVTPGRVCDTLGEELRSSPTSRPKCSPVEASAVVVTVVVPWRVEPCFIWYGATTYKPQWYYGEPWLDHGMTTTVEPWYHGQFCRGTPIPVNSDRSPEVDQRLGKNGSRTNDRLQRSLLRGSIQTTSVTCWTVS